MKKIWSKTLIKGKKWSGNIGREKYIHFKALEPDANVSMLLYNMRDISERYNMPDTLKSQYTAHLTKGNVLMSDNAREKIDMHNCRDTFIFQISKPDEFLCKRDLAPNINFFMNVPVTKEGGLKFDDGVSSPGKYVEMKALVHTMVLISNCPQLNNPCNAYNPTTVRLLIWDAE